MRAKEVVLSHEAQEELATLVDSSVPEHQSVARRVHKLKEILLANVVQGEVVKQDSIPPSLRERYGLANLYVEDLPAFWRLLYTSVKKRGDRYVVVLRIVPHRIYSKWFRGRR